MRRARCAQVLSKLVARVRATGSSTATIAADAPARCVAAFRRTARLTARAGPGWSTAAVHGGGARRRAGIADDRWPIRGIADELGRRTVAVGEISLRAPCATGWSRV